MQLATKQDFVDYTQVTLPPLTATGLTATARIMTRDGERPLTELTIGQTVITRDAGLAVLRSIQSTTVNVAAIKIMAGSLGHTRPHSDMIIAPDTMVHIHDWRAKALFGVDVAIVKAKRLIDQHFITQGATTTITLHELVFDKQHIIYANGLEVASGSK